MEKWVLQKNRIQATIPCHLVRRFAHMLRENDVYIIYYFRVIENCHGSIFSHNNRRLIFCSKTEVVPAKSVSIDHYGVSLLSANEILARKIGFNSLVDTIGVLINYQFDFTEMSATITTPVLKFELADFSGRFACALSGEYVNEFRYMLLKSADDHPTVLFQFAKISTERGFVCVENYRDLTRVTYNTLIPPAYEFNMSLSNAGGPYSLIHGNKANSIVVSDITPFDRLYPHKTVREFIDTPESGFFLVCAKVIGMAEVKNWWYPVCLCGRFLTICDRSYYCPNCNIHIFAVAHKFKLQLAIDDGTATALIQLTEQSLRGIHSLNQTLLGSRFALCHYGAQIFNGKDILLILSKSARSVYGFDDYVEIINMTDEEGSLNRFHELGKDFTPTKFPCMPTVEQFYTDAAADELISSVSPFLNKGKSLLVDTIPASEFTCPGIGAVSSSNPIKAMKQLMYNFSELGGEGPSYS